MLAEGLPGPESVRIPEYDPTAAVLAIQRRNVPEELHSAFTRMLAARDARVSPREFTDVAPYLGGAITLDMSAGCHEYQDCVTAARTHGSLLDGSMEPPMVPDFLFGGEMGLGLDPLGYGHVEAITILRHTILPLSGPTAIDRLSVYFTTNTEGLIRTDDMLFQVEDAILVSNSSPKYSCSINTTWPNGEPEDDFRDPGNTETQEAVEAILKHILLVVKAIERGQLLRRT